MPELNIGKAIKRLRRDHDITQEELAADIGVIRRLSQNGRERFHVVKDIL